jgi:hypothetical protein
MAAIALLCLSEATTACAGASEPVVSPASSLTASDPPPVTSWFAGLRVERDPDALDEETQALAAVLGGSLVVSPASCFRGLPDEVGSSTYVLGAVAPTRTELDGLVTRSTLDALFEVEVEVLCTD